MAGGNPRSGAVLFLKPAVRQRRRPDPIGIPEGKGIGKALNRLLQLVLDETLENQKELLLKKAKSLDEVGLLAAEIIKMV